MLLLLCIALWFILQGGLYCLALCFVLMFFCPLSIVITRPGEERAGLCAFHAFAFSLVDLCLFPLPLGVREWL